MSNLQLTLCLFWLLLAIGCDDGTRQTKQNQHALGSIEQHDTMDRLVSDFMEVPLEGINEDGDSCAYRHACETAEMIVGEIWRLTRDPDKVIDCWTIQRKRFETEAERCESAFRRAIMRGLEIVIRLHPGQGPSSSRGRCTRPCCGSARCTRASSGCSSRRGTPTACSRPTRRTFRAWT